MEISVAELNELLQKEFDRGRQCPIPQINVPYVQVKDWNFDKNNMYYTTTDIPAACKHCSNHPSNGGSGICHCTLGLEPIKCDATNVSSYTTTASSDIQLKAEH